MPNEESINEIVSPKAISQVEVDLVKALEKSNLALQDNIKSVAALNDAIANSKGFASYNKNTADAAKAQEQLAKITASRQLAEERLSAFQAAQSQKRQKEQDAQIAKSKEISLEEAKVSQAIAKSNGEIRNQAKEINAAKGSLDQRAAALTRLQNAYAKLSEQERNSPFGQRLSKTLPLLNNQVLTLEKSLGKAGRNVGNYTNAIGNANGVSQEFTRIIQDAPFGLIGIGNNITQLTENFKNYSKAVKDAAAAEGKSVSNSSILKGALSNLLSPINLLSLGISLIVSGFTAYQLWAQRSAKATKDLNKEGAEYIDTLSGIDKIALKGQQNAVKETESLKLLYEATQNLKIPTDERIRAAKALQEQYPKTFSNFTQEQILLGQASSGYKQLASDILLVARAAAGVEIITENTKKIVEQQLKYNKAKIQEKKLIQEIASEVAKEKSRRDADDEKLRLTSTLNGGNASQNPDDLIALEKRKQLLDVQNTINSAQKTKTTLTNENLKVEKLITDEITERQSVTSLLGVQESQEKKTKGLAEALRVLAENLKKVDDNTTLTFKESTVKKISAYTGALGSISKIKGSDAANEIRKINQELLKLKALLPKETKKTASKKDKIENPIESAIKDSIEIINNDKASFQERLGALESFLSASNQLYKNKEGERSKALIDYKAYEKKINDDANKAILDQFTKDEQERIRVLQQSNSNELEINEQKRSAVALALDSQYADGIISKEEYDAKIYQLDKKASMDAIKLQLDTLDAILEIQRQDLFNGIGSEDEYTANLKKQAELRIKYSKIEVDAKIKAREDSAKAAEKELDAIKQLTAKSLEFGKALIDGIYTRRLNALADESAALNKKKQQDIENVNDSVLTEQQKADQIAIINARADAQQTVIDEKIRQQKIKQAKADKAQAIAQIIIQTALAQVKVIGQAGLLGFVFSPLITALGALSLATALATPIPQFEKGGTVKRDGQIITGEAGTELRINPDGSQELTASQANLSYAKAGTKIIPNHELVRMMAKPDQIQYVGGQSVDMSKLIESNDKLGKKLTKAFGDQSVHSTIVTKNGWFANNTKMARVKNHINRNFS